VYFWFSHCVYAILESQRAIGVEKQPRKNTVIFFLWKGESFFCGGDERDFNGNIDFSSSYRLTKFGWGFDGPVRRKVLFIVKVVRDSEHLHICL